MTHKLSIEAIKTLLIACHEAKRVVELQPPLPEGLTPGNLKVLDYIEYLERTAQPPKVSDIADLLQVTRPGITKASLVHMRREVFISKTLCRHVKKAAFCI